MKQDWINLVSQFPKKGGYWEFSILPHIGIASGPSEGTVIGIGWLFWTVLIFIEPWE